MRFEVKKHTEVVSKNILGKTVETTTFYTIDKVVWHIFRFAIKFSSPCGNTVTEAILNWDYVNIEYRTPDYATQFKCKQMAEKVLHDIKTNPNRYRI